MQLKTLLISILPTLALAQGPGDPGFYNTVAEIYAGPDCSEDTFVWADPIFGRGGMCQLLDRNNNTPDIVSYKVISQYPGCSATIYTDADCLSTPHPAPVGQCISTTADAPFIMAFVQCPFS